MMSQVLDDVKGVVGKFAKNKAALGSAGAETKIRSELGVSSANLVDMVLEFEERFNVSISDDELGKVTTLGDAVSLIERLRKK
jgi:acyl carrier protein